MVMFFSPFNAEDASPPVPPATSITAATAPVSTPQKITVRRDGSIVPRSDSVPMTIEAASAPETKKMPTRTITRTVVTLASGYWSSSWNSTPSKLTEATPPALDTRSSAVVAVVAATRWASMAAPPKIANHTRVTMLGTSSTPVTNWRMVRPRLIRAMNMPTNGVHEIHQAQ